MALLQPIKTSSTSSLLGLSFFVVFTACYCCCCATITTCAFVTVPGILLTTTTTTTTTTTRDNNNTPTPAAASTVEVGSTSTAAVDVIHTHDWREVSVQIPKPLGLIIEEVDATDPSQGVEIVQIAMDGNTAATNRQQQQPPRKIMMTNTTSDDIDMDVVCVGDRIRVVNGVKCSTYDEVMDQIVSSSDQHPIALILGRPSDSVVVQFQLQQGSSSSLSSSKTSSTTNGGGVSGVCVTAQPGNYLGNIANQPGIDYSIPYSCRTGRCGICEQSLSLLLLRTAKKKKKSDGTTTTIQQQQQQWHSQTVRPCVYRIPKNKNILSLHVAAVPTTASSKNRVVSP